MTRTLDNRTTVLHVITRMVKGGAQENTLATVLRVDPKRYRSLLVTGPSEGPEGSLMERARAMGADITLVPSLVREVSPLDDIRATQALFRLMRHERPAIVHTHTSKAGIVGRIAARRAGVPAVVHTPHGHVFHDYFGSVKTRVFISVERYCARFAVRIVMLTENERREHIELKIAPPDRFVTIHSGVDFGGYVASPPPRGALREPLCLGATARIIGTVGRLVPIKGQTHLIAAMPQIVRQVPDAHLALVGSGPLLAELQEQARSLKVEHRVHFAGFRDDVAECMADMDLFALPSLNEGMGRVLVEAMALRLPVVASSVSGIRDLVIPEENGLLVPAGDANALAAAVIRIMNDRELAARFGAAGFARVVPDYSMDRMLDRIERLYMELIERNGKPWPR
jgi:glycosyltransferase involved in cell wall biosynthesis